MEKIKIELDYKCFPVWIYNDNNELVTNDLPEYLIGDETIDLYLLRFKKHMIIYSLIIKWILNLLDLHLWKKRINF